MSFFEYIEHDFKAWAKKPYDENHDLFQWFLTIGALTCAAYLWTRVISRLKG